MKRRDFLLASAAAWAAGPAAAHTATGHGGHGQHDHATTANAAPALPEGLPLSDLPRLDNRATTPGLFEADLAAGPATVRYVPDLETPVLAYNGECPGPLIEATEGDRVRIAFRNDIPGQPSSIHWHGLQVPADQDGNPLDAVASGAVRVYEFTLPEGSAGSYWYHPHPHGFTAEQVYRGLNGVFLVRPKADPIPVEYGDTILFMTDLRIAADGTMPESTMADRMNGRVGDHVLVNGQKNPFMVVPAGTRHRFRLFNAMNGRYLRLTFGDAGMTIIGTDGGLIEAPVPGIREVLLVPAERLEVVVAFDRPGTVRLQTLPYDRGWMGPGVPDDGDMTLLTVEVAEAATPVVMPPLPAVLRSIPPLGEPAVTRRFELGEVMGGRMAHAPAGGGHAAHGHGSAGAEMVFLIDGKTFDMHRVDIRPRVGDVELWEIANPTDMDHPFHVHGTQFQIVEVEGPGGLRKPPYRGWKDTVNVRPGETARFLIRQDMPGLRLYHCHILEHGELGMMANAEVIAVG